MSESSMVMEDRHFTRSEAAYYLGMSLRWFEDLLKRPNPPPGFKLGSRWLFRKSELDGWMEQFRRVGQREEHLYKRDLS